MRGTATVKIQVHAATLGSNFLVNHHASREEDLMRLPSAVGKSPHNKPKTAEIEQNFNAVKEAILNADNSIRFGSDTYSRPPLQKLANLLGCSVSNVGTRMRQMEGLGLIKIKKFKNPINKNSLNNYYCVNL